MQERYAHEHGLKDATNRCWYLYSRNMPCCNKFSLVQLLTTRIGEHHLLSQCAPASVSFKVVQNRSKRRRCSRLRFVTVRSQSIASRIRKMLGYAHLDKDDMFAVGYEWQISVADKCQVWADFNSPILTSAVTRLTLVCSSWLAPRQRSVRVSALESARSPKLLRLNLVLSFHRWHPCGTCR